MSFHHDHEHYISPTNTNSKNKWRFIFGIVLNIVYTIIEVKFSFSANSSALLAEAGHHLSDVLSIVLAWIGTYFASIKHYNHFTYGFRKANIFFAAFNILLLFSTISLLIYSGSQHLMGEQEIEGHTILIVSLIGIAINLLTVYIFNTHDRDDLNIQNAYYHSLLDAVVSIGVVIGGGVIWLTNWTKIDAIITFLIAATMLYNVFKLMGRSLKFVLDAVPQNINYEEVVKYLNSLNQVECAHDLHVWGISTTEIALSVHLCVNENLQSFPFKQVNDELFHKFGISHIAIQIEKKNCGQDCGES